MFSLKLLAIKIMKLSKTTKYVLGGLGVGLVILVLYLVFKRSSAGCSGPSESGNGFKSVKGSDGQICQSFLNKSSYPRGIRNNNVGNIKRGNSAWKGKIPHNLSKDNVFEQFESYAYGIRAMIYLLDKNYIQAGHNTLRKLLTRYAPDSGPTTYLDYVNTQTNIQKDKVLKGTKTELKKIVQAMAKYENGITGTRQAVTDEQFNAGWNLYKS